jgi:hypothetical protein
MCQSGVSKRGSLKQTTAAASQCVATDVDSKNCCIQQSLQELKEKQRQGCKRLCAHQSCVKRDRKNAPLVRLIYSSGPSTSSRMCLVLGKSNTETPTKARTRRKVTHLVVVCVLLGWIGLVDAVVTHITNAVLVLIQLLGIRNAWTIVARVAQPVPVSVNLCTRAARHINYRVTAEASYTKQSHCSACKRNKRADSGH